MRNLFIIARCCAGVNWSHQSMDPRSSPPYCAWSWAGTATWVAVILLLVLNLGGLDLVITVSVIVRASASGSRGHGCEHYTATRSHTAIVVRTIVVGSKANTCSRLDAHVSALYVARSRNWTSACCCSLVKTALLDPPCLPVSRHSVSVLPRCLLLFWYFFSPNSVSHSVVGSSGSLVVGTDPFPLSLWCLSLTIRGPP